MRKFAILGETLGHTMSPPIHKELFEIKNREFEYEILEIAPKDLKANRELLDSLNGYNITIPHKMSIIDFTDELDSSAKRYNSVNCIVNKGGKHIGYNTDCNGFLETIKSMNIKFEGNVLLIGCGGVGRMMAIEAALAGAELYIAVLESDLVLAQKVQKEIKAIKPDAKINIVLNTEINTDINYTLLMNACPVGMYPQTDACPVGDEVIKASDAVFDVIYNPIETVLMKKAKTMGKKACGGMAMLVWQAVVAHKIWDGDEYTNEEVQSIIHEMEKKVAEDFK